MLSMADRGMPAATQQILQEQCAENVDLSCMSGGSNICQIAHPDLSIVCLTSGLAARQKQESMFKVDSIDNDCKPHQVKQLPSVRTPSTNKHGGRAAEKIWHDCIWGATQQSNIWSTQDPDDAEQCVGHLLSPTC